MPTAAVAELSTAARVTDASAHAVPARYCGAVALGGGRVRWRAWAPKLQKLNLVLLDGDDRTVVPMAPEGDGHYVAERDGIHEGQKYKLCFDGFECRADPCSLWQPDGVAGPSAVYMPERFGWTDPLWRGVPRQDLVIYELHVGTFTPKGTFEAVIDRLDDLKDLGVTAIEIMPVAQFPGDRNWGYDGVLPYAAQNTYGGPAGLQKLVDAAHAKGVAVILDVVYNHLGPEHSYVREFGPYFTDKYKTPWGEALNYDDKHSDPVRRFVLDNVRMWLEEFHLDGLRLDAVHAIYDLGAKHLLQEIGEVAADVQARSGRLTHIVAESDLNDPRVVNPVDRGGHGLDAQWADDFHHAVHAALTGERRGYYMDYGSAELVAEAMRTPFLGAGEYSHHRGRRHGAPPTGLSGDRFVVCVQNHDQVGNRAVGDRLSTILAVQGEHGPAKTRLAAALLLFAPHLPMLFMGEEYGETRPFPFFCSFGGAELIEAVRQGRKREFADFLSGDEEIPDPAGVETFQSAVLSWAWPDGSPQAGIRQLYQDLLTARRQWPALRDYDRRAVRFVPATGHPNPAADGDAGHPAPAGVPAGGDAGGVIELVRGGTAAGPGTVVAYFNLTDRVQRLPHRPAGGDGASGAVGPALFSSEFTSYGGPRVSLDGLEVLRPFECAAWDG
jgi:maltooligosyltrehalose trehalohydrolase